MSKRIAKLDHPYEALPINEDEDISDESSLGYSSSFNDTVALQSDRTREQDFLSFPEWPLWVCVVFALALMAQQIALPAWRANIVTNGNLPIRDDINFKSAVLSLPFVSSIVLFGLLLLVYLYLLIRRQVTSLTAKSYFLAFFSGIFNGLALILLNFACDATPSLSHGLKEQAERLGANQQLALTAAWVTLAWPLAYYLYPGAVGHNSVDLAILIIVQLASLVAFALGFVPSFHLVSNDGGKPLIWASMWTLGIFCFWFGRSLLWSTTAKPRNWRDVVTLVFYSSFFQLIVVCIFSTIDFADSVGYSTSFNDLIRNNLTILKELPAFPTNLAVFIIYVVGHFITSVFPSKTYLNCISPIFAFVIFNAVFYDVFASNADDLKYIFPSISLGFMAVCFWGFMEGRIRWQAEVIRGRLRRRLDAPLLRASFLSKLFFCWNIPLLKFGFQQKIQMADVPDIVAEEQVESSYAKFKASARERGWRGSLFSVVPIFFSTFGYAYFFSLIGFIVFLTCSLFTPGFLLPSILGRIAIINTKGLPIETVDSAVEESYYLVLGLTISAVVGAIGYQQGWTWGLRCGIRARISFIMAVYEKILTVRRLQSVGEVVNFLSSDSARIIEAIRFGWWLVLAPISLFVIMGLLIGLIGPISLVGMLILFLQMPIQLFVGSKIGSIREKAVDLTDERVKIMNDILTSIKTVKLYCWEESFADQVAEIRGRESAELSRTAAIKYFNLALSFFSPTLATMISLALYYGAINKHATVDSVIVFTVASLFNAAASPLACLPMAIANLAQSFVGIDRLQKLMNQTDLKDTRILNMGRGALVRIKTGRFSFDYDPEADLAQQLNTTSDDHDSVSLRPAAEDEDLAGSFILSGVNVNIDQPGKLIAIVGRVGSGKSCYLSAIAGHLNAIEGTVEVNGSIAFMTQGGLLVNATVKENILFGEPYDEERYLRTCEACELLADFKILPKGDQTEVGEKGATLSGGQKARVGLARAVYSDRDIYLLDDPLSAVDARVGARIFSKCMKGALKSKITVLVTNQPQYLPGCDEIIVLSEGRQVAHGTFDEIKAEEEFAQLLNVQQPTPTGSSNDVSSSTPASSSVNPTPLPSSSNAQGSMVIPTPMVDDPRHSSDDDDTPNLPLSSSLDELNRLTENQRSVSSIKLRSAHSSARHLSAVMTDHAHEDVGDHQFTEGIAKDIASSFKNVGPQQVPVPATPLDKDDVRENATLIADEDATSQGVSGATFMYYCFACGTFGPVAVTALFVVTQLNRLATDLFLSIISLNPPPMNLKYLLLIYAAVVICFFFMLMGRAAAFAKVAIANATAIHNDVFAKVLKAPLSFFESNPLGRILNRFSRDLDIVDGRLPDFFIDAFIFIVHCLSIMILICIIIPWFTFLVGLMALAFWMLITYYQRSARELKRLDAVSSSPIFAHLSVSIAGIATIRAYNAQDRFIKDNKDLIDRNTKANFGFEATSNWVGLCLDLLSAAITTFVGLLTVWLAKSIPEFAGLVLTYSLMMTAAFQYAVRVSTETENLLVAAQRLKEYADTLTPEGLRDNYARPPANWPTEGRIQFKDVVVKYRPELPPVLRRVNFTVNPREKVGIVGRTGAGKSTLIQVLFRLIEPAGGDILIDGVSTIDLDLPDLRRKLACIPQDPVLFVGTIRSNLDPFNEHTDEDLWDALDRVHMKAMVEAMPDSISSTIVEGGINFSLGQRQLICIARAILRGARILVMDEATAAIDMESDQLIQNTVRSSFTDVTVLTIAHRLATIMDYDRIMVVAEGGIAEFDSPKRLLENPNGIFYSMYHQH